MEPNASSSSADGTFPAIVEQGLSSTHAIMSHLSPPSFLQHPSPSLVSAFGSGFGSPAAGAEGSLSVHGHATPESLPSSSFPALGAVHRTGGDVFAQPEAPAATHLPTLLVGGQPRDVLAQPSSWTATGLLPASEGAFSGFASQSELLEQIEAWAPQSEMPFVSPPSGTGLPPRSRDIAAGSAQPPSDCQLAPLPASLRIPSLEETTNTYDMSSTFGESMLPWHCGGSSMDVGGSISSMPTTGAMKASLLPMKHVHIDAAHREPEFISPMYNDDEYLPVLGNSTARDLNNAWKLIYEKEIISKDKKLQELMKSDPKKVKRIIADRFSAAKRKAIKDMRILELERQVEILQGQYNTLSAELPLLQGRCAELQTQRNEMSIMMLELEHQVLLKDAVSETLQAQIQALNFIKLNAVQMNSKNIDQTNVGGAHGLHQQNSTQITDGSGSCMNDLHQQMSPHMVLLHQLQMQEQPSEHQQSQAQQP